MASLAGVPLTLGFVGRWHLYHSLLTGGNLTFLALSLLAETFLFANTKSPTTTIQPKYPPPSLTLPTIRKASAAPATICPRRL